MTTGGGGGGGGIGGVEGVGRSSTVACTVSRYESTCAICSGNVHPGDRVFCFEVRPPAGDDGAGTGTRRRAGHRGHRREQGQRRGDTNAVTTRRCHPPRHVDIGRDWDDVQHWRRGCAPSDTTTSTSTGGGSGDHRRRTTNAGGDGEDGGATCAIVTRIRRFASSSCARTGWNISNTVDAYEHEAATTNGRRKTQRRRRRTCPTTTMTRRAASSSTSWGGRANCPSNCSTYPACANAS